MEISVIIPVYKTEEYLKECIDHILARANQDVEVILVDDGSPDRCPQICDEFAKADPRVRVVHKENGGLSSARNAGLAVAKGKYITFVDSDDKIFPDSIPEILLWTGSENADICFMKCVKLYPDGTQKDLGEGIERSCLKAQSRQKAVEYLATRAKYPGSAWGKLFRREFLIAHDLHFPYDRRYSEDLGFMRDCILCAQTFDALEVPYYQYRQNRPGSITNIVTSKNFYDLLRFITESSEKLTSNKQAVDPISKLAMSFAAYEYNVLLYLYNFIPEEDKKNAFAKLKEYKWVLRFACNTKGIFISHVCGIFGIRCASFLMNQYRKTK